MIVLENECGGKKITTKSIENYKFVIGTYDRLRISMDRISDSPACVTQSGRDSEEVGFIICSEVFFGSVVQWIVFQIPILKMQVRFLPGSLIFQIWFGLFISFKVRLIQHSMLVCRRTLLNG